MSKIKKIDRRSFVKSTGLLAGATAVATVASPAIVQAKSDMAIVSTWPRDFPGGRLFRAAREELTARHLDGLCIWSLACNERACDFYSHLGGRRISEGLEQFGDTSLRKISFAWR